jgi:hypothetical protein
MTPAEKINRLVLRAAPAELVDYVGVNRGLFNSLINTYIQGPDVLRSVLPVRSHTLPSKTLRCSSRISSDWQLQLQHPVRRRR